MILKHATTWNNISLYVNDLGDSFSLTRQCGLLLKKTNTNNLGHKQKKYHSEYYQKILVHTTIDGSMKYKNYWLHILVCTAFHGPRPSPTHQVDHIDRDRFNNHPSNLRWVTPHENQMNTIRHIRKIERERLRKLERDRLRQLERAPT